ncbi:MAG: membrane protein insertase YidC [Bacteroidales bacterium]|nr:membrane protein insertase YidC [Bacteroidales bacterium]
MDRNSIIGFVLIFAILFGFSWYQSSVNRKNAEYAAAADSVYRAQHPAPEMVSESGDIAGMSSPVTASRVEYKDNALTLASAGDAEYVTLENDKVVITLSSAGAQPYSVKIKDYYYYDKQYDSTGLYLIKPGKSVMNMQVYAGESISTKEFAFQIASASDSAVVFQLPFSQGGCIQYTYTLPRDSYKADLDIAFIGMDGVLPRNVSSFNLDWGLQIPRMEKGYKNEKQYSKLNYYFDGDKKPVELARGRDAQKSVSTPMRWFAFQQQFFSAILTSPTDFANASFDVRYGAEDDPDKVLMTATASVRQEFMPSPSEIHIPLEFYFGPNDFNILKSMDCKYEKIVPLGGWLVGWITRIAIIPLFHWLGGFISSFGIIILIMTLILKIVISPLTIKSYKSSAVMSALKPEMEKINERYPKQEDAMKKQSATMDLYKKAGVSPMGGCLPMLLQFPVLWAMFRFFPASIELRQQSFLWAEDLSSYDSILDFGFNIPLYGDHMSLFAILMAVSMFIYSKMNSDQMSSDPNMAGMKFMSVWMMPIMMLFICNNLSSGLSYYYFLSNLLTMAQTWAIKKWLVHPEKILAKVRAAEGKSAPKSKWQMRLEEAQKMQRAQAKAQARKK